MKTETILVKKALKMLKQKTYLYELFLTYIS